MQRRTAITTGAVCALLIIAAAPLARVNDRPEPAEPADPKARGAMRAARSIPPAPPPLLAPWAHSPPVTQNLALSLDTDDWLLGGPGWTPMRREHGPGPRTPGYARAWPWAPPGYPDVPVRDGLILPAEGASFAALGGGGGGSSPGGGGGGGGVSDPDSFDPAAVPEPTSLGMVAVLTGAMWLARRPSRVGV